MGCVTAENIADLAGLAALLADRSRASICIALLDGRAWTIGELARHAGVAPSTASEHVARLAGGGLVQTLSQGRHRYVRIAGSTTAELIENMAVHSAATAAAQSPGGGSAATASRPISAGPGPGRTLRAASAAEAMARARTCYDHLAGRLAVRITDAMISGGLLDRTSGLAVTDAGLAWLSASLGIEESTLRATSRPVARSCLDWTERRPHLGGAAGAAICGRFLVLGWIARIGTGRAVRLTPAGLRLLPELCPIDLQDVA
jgi:DNA-binding transcriptional ArsR family regulator